eukprot:GFKZ01014476.1.p1 GENE.GFKZ01014476.1~~GFKZ01014476.1.p1  ORF type:complete len:634 (-),score=88.55 GFKZ01014476.1:153-2054(-)
MRIDPLSADRRHLVTSSNSSWPDMYLNGNSPPASHVKFVLVSGGVISGIGKGLTASSLGVLLKCCGWRVTAIKIDPYLNTDAGTMSPFEHGEVFVLDDGGEADLDLGNYERFLDVTLNRDNNITTGKVYSQVLERERKGSYLGKTVQVVPHVTDAIQEWIMRVATTPDQDGLVPEICVIELGGTIGDIESMPFVEALRQLRYNVGEVNFCSVFVSLIPMLGVVGEQKTKPTQHGVKNISSMGLSPQLIVCRSEQPLRDETKRKLALFCQVAPDAVASVHDVSNTYRIPMMLQEQGVCNLLIRTLHLVWRLPTRLEKWARMAERVDHAAEKVKICLVGKYTGLSDAYLSVIRALQHAGMAVGRKVDVVWVESSDLEIAGHAACDTTSSPNGTVVGETGARGGVSVSPGEGTARYEAAWELLRSADGILVPGGFGDRGVEGKISAISYAREQRVPFLGICLGMQMAAVEAVRRVFQEDRANSVEFDSVAPLHAVVHMPEVCSERMGGTMRLGVRKTEIKKEDCLAAWLYGGQAVYERHRHRYEVNPKVVGKLEKEDGIRFVGTDESGMRMEILERSDHPFFLGTQYHPEFKSRPGRPSPPFVGLIMAAAGMALDRKSVETVVGSIRSQDPWKDTE